MISRELSWLLSSKDAPPSGLDVRRLASLAISHGLALPSHPSARKAATGDLRHRANLATILRRFREADVPVVPFKGPVLADQLYSTGNVRVYNDLDLLVQPQDVMQALGVLRSLAYRPKIDVADPPTNPVLRFGGEMALKSPRMASPVDLHWKLLGWSAPFPARLRQVWDCLEPGEWQGRPILRLPPTELAAYLCYHGSKHLWLQLKQLFDLTRLFELGLPVDWDGLLREAERESQTRFLLLGPLLAHRLLHAPAPKSWLERCKEDRPLNEIAGYVTAALETPDEWRKNIVDRGVWSKLLETKGAAARYFCLEALGPSAADWQSARFPEHLSLLYYPYRPLRLAGVRLRKLFRAG